MIEIEEATERVQHEYAQALRGTELVGLVSPVGRIEALRTDETDIGQLARHGERVGHRGRRQVYFSEDDEKAEPTLRTLGNAELHEIEGLVGSGVGRQMRAVEREGVYRKVRLFLQLLAEVCDGLVGQPVEAVGIRLGDIDLHDADAIVSGAAHIAIASFGW